MKRKQKQMAMYGGGLIALVVVAYYAYKKFHKQKPAMAGVSFTPMQGISFTPMQGVDFTPMGYCDYQPMGAMAEEYDSNPFVDSFIDSF